MNVCFFHGLESDGPGRKGRHLANLGWSLYAPTIDYRHPSSVRGAWTEALAKPRDAFVGSSMGGVDGDTPRDPNRHTSLVGEPRCHRKNHGTRISGRVGVAPS